VNAAGAPLFVDAERPLGVDAEHAPLEAVEASICHWAGRIAVATCGWLGLLAAFDRRGGDRADPDVRRPTSDVRRPTSD
jgi:hypothetical protein